MNFVLEKKQNTFTTLFNEWLDDYFQQCARNSYRSDILLESQIYSLKSEGKKFRPFLAFLVFDLFSQDYKQIRSLCLALEMVHTYSLIHDDLPCMDNDDTRRGKPSNHKAFSEDIALLAGDGLLTDVFYILSSDSALTHETRTKLISMLSIQIGSFGMVSGQVRDMKADEKIKLDELKTIHNLKTANLIEASAMGAAIISKAKDHEIETILEYSHSLGMAFQIKDDILDSTDKKEDYKNYVSILGLAKTQTELQSYSKRALNALENLKKLGYKTVYLEELIKINSERAE